MTKKGYLFWIFACLLGSIVESLLFSVWINDGGAFDFKESDAIFLTLLLFILSMFFSLPFVLFLRRSLKRRNVYQNQFLFHNLSIFIFLLGVYILLIIFNLLSTREALFLVLPYWLVGTFALNVYVYLINKFDGV